MKRVIRSVPTEDRGRFSTNPSSGLQRTVRTLTVLAILVALGGLSPTPIDAQAAQKVLFVSFGQYTGDGVSAFNMLVAAGADADYVLLAGNPGSVVAALASDTYDQLWSYDLSSGGDPYDADFQAIADWYLAHPTQTLICDGRFLSSYWSGRWNTEGRVLAENYYRNLETRGGGLILATDHNVYANNGTNEIAALIGVDPFIGNFGGGFPTDPLNPLMNTPNAIASLFNDSSTSQAPFGLQPNGDILYAVGYHSGNVTTPGISSTIEGAIGFHVDITAPAPDSQVCGASFDLETEVSGEANPVTYAWSSDIDGALGTGTPLTVMTAPLTSGEHVITVLATDALDQIDNDSVTVTVGNCGAANVPGGEQVGYTTSGSLRQIVAVSAGDVCTAGLWVGKRSDGVGNSGNWNLQLTNGSFVHSVLSDWLTFQVDEWEHYDVTFTVPSYLTGTIQLQLTGYGGFESYDEVELDCGGGDLVSNGSFEDPAIPDGKRSPAGGNPLPVGWSRIRGAGHFNPNTTQFNDFF